MRIPKQRRATPYVRCDLCSVATATKSVMFDGDPAQCLPPTVFLVCDWCSECPPEVYGRRANVTLTSNNAMFELPAAQSVTL